jgi:hypothetical protein
MKRNPLRRVTISALLGAPLPLAFIGSLALQTESHAHHVDRTAFHVLLPILLFGMMAFAIWILMRRPVGHPPISSMRR